MDSTLVDPTLLFLAYIDYKNDRLTAYDDLPEDKKPYADCRYQSYADFRYKMVTAVACL